MRVNPYTEVAKIYSHLMKDIDYKDWSEYLLEINSIYNPTKGNYLELACGNGILAGLLSEKFNNLVISDLSFGMLQNGNNLSLPKVCCSMTDLPFKSKFDFIFSAFDSINYLTNRKSLKKLFENIYSVLDRNGIFTFDVSLENNSWNNIEILNREGNFNNIEYKQKSVFNPINRIHKNTFNITLPNNKKYSEVHKQKIYYFEDYFEVIERTNLHVVECFDAFSFEDAFGDEERVQFIVKKRDL